MSSIKTITAAAVSIRSGELNPSQLVEQCLEQIQRFERSIRAWVIVDERGARQTAEALTNELNAGQLRGPLHGVPIGIKDIIDVAGLPTRAGSPLIDSAPALRDAEVVRRLGDAGAIILGKTVTTEFACFDPSPTRNPWNLTHTPGGSSSGSAAAVAAGMCFGAIGTQTGGSITRPAAYCGVCGLKPAFGEVSRDGVIPVSPHLDHVGPIAPSAADLEILYGAMTDAELLAEIREPVQLAWPKGNLWSAADAQTQQLFSGAVETLRASGVHIRELDPPFNFAEIISHHRTIMAVDAAQYHRRAFQERRAGYGPNISSLIEQGLAASVADYEAALDHQRTLTDKAQRWFAEAQAWIMPATPAAAPADLATTGDPRFNSPWSYLGVPTVTIPYAITSDGLPVGLQMVASRSATQQLLQVARKLESLLTFAAEAPLGDQCRE